jgi:hypothetical protein
MNPATIAPSPSGLAGDPRLAKLKEASLTRRRVLPSGYSIPAFRDDHGILPDEIAESQKENEIETINNPTAATTAAAPSSSSRLMSTGDALRILNLDSAASEVVEDNGSTRLHRIQAVRSLASTKNSTPTALDHLRRRLRSTTAQLAFHEANASSLNTTTTQKSGDNSAPWLPSSTVSGSKHKAAQLQAQAKKKNNAFNLQQQQQVKENSKPPRPSPQASALQAKLLSELKNRLLLKAVLLALRQAAQQRNLREGLVERAVAVEKQATLRDVFKAWKQTTLPSKEMVCAAEFHEYERQVYVAKEALQVWKAWSAAQQRRQAAASAGAAAHRHRLLAGAFAHWKFATNMRHLSMLRSALVEGWVDTWGRRKALLAWRRTARRQRQQRDALLAATSTARNNSPSDKIEDVEVEDSEDHVVPGQFSSTPATLAEAAANQRAQARSQFSGLKLCIAQVAAELEVLRPGLRWTTFNDNPSNVSLVRPQYDPAAYSSPIKRRRQQYIDGTSSASASNPALVAAEEIAAELFNCNEELEQVENECHALRDMLRKLEEEERALLDKEAAEVLLVAQQAEQDVSVAMMAFEDAENELHEAQVVLEIVNEEIEVQKTLLSKCLHEASTSRAAADAAAAALASARDEFETSSTAVDSWTRKVTLAAAELSRDAPNNKSAAALKLIEARHRLEMEKLAATEAHQEIPSLLETSQEAAELAERCEAALIASQQSAIAASSAEATASSDFHSAQAAFSAAESALQDAQTSERASISAYNATVEKAAGLHDEARQVRLQLFTREREVAVLQSRVGELDESHAQFVALSLEYEQESDDLELLDSPSKPIAVLQGEEDLALHTFSMDAGGDADGPSTSLPIELAIDLHDEVNEDLVIVSKEDANATWSIATTPFSSPSKDPCSLTAAARHFYQSRLLRRAVHALQNEASLWKELNAMSSYRYCVSILPAAFEAWKEATADALAIDGANVEIARVLSCLKAWRRYTGKAQLLRHLEAEYIEFKSR